MTRVLLTGGSGFIASHVLELLLQRGHTVVTTVRSQEKADSIAAEHSKYTKEQLSFAIVPDIAEAGAFDKAVVSTPPFEAVIHTASPFHFNVKDLHKDMLDPAINGTVGVLKAIKAHAPSVKRVVVTSSFAAILDTVRMPFNTKFTEEHWNGVTMEEAASKPPDAYRASKTYAEKAAWKFVEEEKPNFSLATINPPLVLGPLLPWLNSLSAVNTSNKRFVDLVDGQHKSEITPTGTHLWVDVRDVAEAHVAAMEKSEAGGKRFFVVEGNFCNADIARYILKNFPELKGKVPETEEELKGGEMIEQSKIPGYDNSRSKQVLGLKYKSLESCTVDTVKSVLAAMKKLDS